MAYQRKYKFNWFDHLYYIGKGSRQAPSRWPMPFETLLYSLLMWPWAFSVIFWASGDLQKIVCFLCGIVVILFYDLPLKKYLFTPERKQAYFCRYPQRKHYSMKVLFWIPFTMYITNIVILGFVFYHLSK